MAEGTEDGTEQVGGDVGEGDAGNDLNADVVAVADVVAGDAFDIEEIFVEGDGAPVAKWLSIGDGRRNVAGSNGDGEASGADDPMELRDIDFGDETERSEEEIVGGETHSNTLQMDCVGFEGGKKD